MRRRARAAWSPTPSRVQQALPVAARRRRRIAPSPSAQCPAIAAQHGVHLRRRECAQAIRRQRRPPSAVGKRQNDGAPPPRSRPTCPGRPLQPGSRRPYMGRDDCPPVVAAHPLGGPLLRRGSGTARGDVTAHMWPSCRRLESGGTPMWAACRRLRQASGPTVSRPPTSSTPPRRATTSRYALTRNTQTGKISRAHGFSPDDEQQDQGDDVGRQRQPLRHEPSPAATPSPGR